MRIALVSFNLMWFSGGVRVVYSLAKGLKKSNHEVTIYVPETEYNDKVYPDIKKGINIRLVKIPKGYDWWYPSSKITFLSKIFLKLQKEAWLNQTGKAIAQAIIDDGDNFDVINPHDLAYKTAYYYKKLGGKGKVIEQGNDPIYNYLPHPESWIYDRLSFYFNYIKDFTERKYFKALDGAAVLDFYNKDWYEKRHISNVAIVRLGTDVEKFYAPLKDFSVRAKAKKVQLMGLGTLIPYRGYEYLIEAVKLLRDGGYDARGKILSHDFGNDSALREKLVSLVSKWNLQDYITLNFNSVSDDYIKEVFNESDFFAYLLYLPPPRKGFGFSTSMIEAGAAGLPTILWNTTTSLEVFEDSVNIISIEPLRPDKIAEKVKWLINNPAKYNEIVENLQNLVKKKFTWQIYADNIADFFAKVKRD